MANEHPFNGQIGTDFTGTIDKLTIEIEKPKKKS